MFHEHHMSVVATSVFGRLHDSLPLNRTRIRTLGLIQT